VWAGNGGITPVLTQASLPSPSPASYTPPHLAERIRAEQAALEARGPPTANVRPSLLSLPI